MTIGSRAARSWSFVMMKYRLTEKIGSGGMAEVFRAVGEGPAGFERPFVIKRIHPRLSESPEFVRMFVDEAKISARLIHPNIVQVFEFAPQDGGYYIVMEPVEGFDMGWLLRRRLESRREVPPPAFVAEVGRQACRGLDYAHTLTSADGQPLGIVHRDVTPPNIMVTWSGTVKIVDFGIARAVEALRASVTDAGMVKGKMSYVAPELLNGRTADARSDVFSLGVVLHELLSGRQLFAGENDLETLRLVKEMVIPPPSTRNPGVKRGLDAIVMRALERDPDKRYRSAGAMGDDLETVVLRERYSTRALARKARELAEREDPSQAAGVVADDAIEIVDSAGLGIAPPESMSAPVPVSLPHLSESSPIAAETHGKRPPATPPRIPAHVAATSRHALPGTRRVSWLAVALPSALALVFLGLLLARRPSSAPALPSTAASGSAAATVRVALDSLPQGATVTTGGTIVAGAVQGGRSLGETPLLVELPRGAAPVDLVLAKTGFSPLVFKVIPQQDKDVLARLETVPPLPVPAMVAAATLPLPRPLGPGRHVPGTSRRALLGAGSLRAAPGMPVPTRSGASPMAANQSRLAVPAAAPPAARPAPTTPTFRR